MAAQGYASPTRLFGPCWIRSMAPEEGAEIVPFRQHPPMVVDQRLSSAFVPLLGRQHSLGLPRYYYLEPLPITVIRTRCPTTPYAHPTRSSTLTAALGRHADFIFTALTIIIASPLAATRAHARDVARGCSNATASRCVVTLVIAARVASALSGLGLSRRAKCEHPTTQDGRAHQL
jgi:hypothetical protein